MNSDGEACTPTDAIGCVYLATIARQSDSLTPEKSHTTGY